MDSSVTYWFFRVNEKMSVTLYKNKLRPIPGDQILDYFILQYKYYSSPVTAKKQVQQFMLDPVLIPHGSCTDNCS
jgi:hypothetical protein